MVKQKKAWIKLVESFMAIVLLLGIILLALNNVNQKEIEISLLEKNNLEMIYKIQLNESLRGEVIGVSPLPLDSNNITFPESLKVFLQENLLPGANCTMVVCLTTDECNLVIETGSEIYSSEFLIFTNKTIYSPRKLKLFCYKNEI